MRVYAVSVKAKENGDQRLQEHNLIELNGDPAREEVKKVCVCVYEVALIRRRLA